MKKILYPLLSRINFFRRLCVSFLFSEKRLTIHLFDTKRQKWLDTVLEVSNSTSLMLQPLESYMICMAINATSKLPGSIAEVGVFRGGSAKLICEFKEEKKLFLFDTFEGLPELNEHDTSNEFYKGQFSNTSFEYIKDVLSPYPNVQLYKGYFPETASPLTNENFSFVHLDVDLYQTTKDAIEFFYPKMVKGGIIISHDYVNADGVRKAFDDFFKDKPEPVLVVSDTQCLIVKSDETNF